MKYHESAAEKVNRIYVTTLRDGWGDLGHFKDRATANMRLEPVFREQNPEFYILTINFEKGRDNQKTLQQIKDRLSTLPANHPLNISNLGKTFFIHHCSNKSGLAEGIFTAEQITEFIQGPSIIHGVSTQVDEAILRNVNESAKGKLIRIHSGELNLGGKKGIAGLKSIVNQGIGLGEQEAGLFLKTPGDLGEEEILGSLNKEGINSELIATVFGKDHPGELSAEDLKEFREGTLFIPAYVQSQEFFNKVVKYVNGSELAKGKRVVFLVTGDKKYDFPEDLPDNCQILNYTDRTIDEKTYSVLANLENPYFCVCSGDKSFEAAISNRKIPFFQMYKKGHSKLAFYEDEFLALLRAMKVADEDRELHEGLMRALSEFTQITQDKSSDIDQRVVDYWKTKCIPELHRYNFFEVVEEIESDALMLHKIIYNNDFSLAEKIDDKKLAFTLFHTPLHQSAAILDNMPLERTRRIGEIISETITKMKLQQEVPLVVQTLCSPDVLEAYATGEVKASDLIGAADNIEKVKALISPDALLAYREGYMKPAELASLSLEEVVELTSPQAINAYKTGLVKFSDLRGRRADVIKLLTSQELLEVYKKSAVTIQHLNNIRDPYQISLLISPEALSACDSGYIKIGDIASVPSYDIKPLISPNALRAYATKQITIKDLVSLPEEKKHLIEKLISPHAVEAYKTGQISAKAIIGLSDKKRIDKLISPEVVEAYKTGKISAEDLIDVPLDKIDILISPPALEAYKAGVIDPQAFIGEFTPVDTGLLKLLLSNETVELYQKGFLDLEDIKELDDDKIEFFFKSIAGLSIDNKDIIQRALEEAKNPPPAQHPRFADRLEKRQDAPDKGQQI